MAPEQELGEWGAATGVLWQGAGVRAQGAGRARREPGASGRVLWVGVSCDAADIFSLLARASTWRSADRPARDSQQSVLGLAERSGEAARPLAVAARAAMDGSLMAQIQAGKALKKAYSNRPTTGPRPTT